VKIYLGREFRINMDDYEHSTVTGGVTLSHEDLGISTDQVERMSPSEWDATFNNLAALANERLSNIQLPVLEEIAPHAKRSSFINRMVGGTPRRKKRG